MKKFALVLLALLVAGSAFAEKVPVGDVTPNIAGTLDPNRDALIARIKGFEEEIAQAEKRRAQALSMAKSSQATTPAKP